jgi:hypothetical protein
MPSKRTTYDAGLAECKEWIGSQIYKELERYLLAHEPKWWGEQAGKDMGKFMLLATVLHDCRTYSYSQICKALQPKICIWPGALQHNVKKARRILAQWGDLQVTLPSPAERDRAVAGRNFPDFMKKTRWWMDSTDIPLARLREFKSRKGIYWSGKLKRPAWRYMILRDGTGKIRRVWGGYSPKVFDSDFMASQRQWLEENLAGTAILADTHFFKAREYIKNPDILATPPPNIKEDKLRSRGFALTTKEAAKKSKIIKEHRGVVEQKFANIKRTFLSLSGAPYTVWREPERELDYVVSLAFGVANREQEIRERRD